MEANEFLPTRPNLGKLKVGQRLLVCFNDLTIFYAIYSDFDEFDVHKPDYGVEGDYRAQWYKFSSVTVRQFMILT